MSRPPVELPRKLDLGELLIITDRDEEQIRQDDLAHAADFMPEEND